MIRRFVRRPFIRRRRPIRRRFPLRRKLRIYRRPRSNFLQCKQFVDMLPGDSGIVRAATTFGGFRFLLNQIHQSASFSALFDSYRINAVKIKFSFDRTDAPVGGPTNTTVSMPRFFAIIDYDSSTEPSSIGEITEYNNFKFVSMARPFKMFLRPRTLTPISSSAVATWAYSSDFKQRWIDMTYTNVPYYGIKYIFDGSNSGTDATVVIGRLRAYATFYCQFKSVR